ncbi:hypothetical protein HK104_010819 [Borealophlyctis nickersoniae]|nr:hypothetical protein HK104_010819 [Borealophlyctis nickersoniae]
MVIPKTTSWTINGSVPPSKSKQIPSDLKLGKDPPQVLPYLSPRRVFSKAEQWATDWFNRTEELKRIQAFQENTWSHLNLNGSNTPQIVRNVEVVNTAGIPQPESTPNPSFDPEPTYQPPRSPPPPPSGNDFVQLNPVSKEVSTMSTQTMHDYIDAATSTPPVRTASVGTSAAPSVSSVGTSAYPSMTSTSTDMRRMNALTTPLISPSERKRPGSHDHDGDRPSRRRRLSPAEIIEATTSSPLQPEPLVPPAIIQAANPPDDLPPSYQSIENDLVQPPPPLPNPNPHSIYDAHRVVTREEHQAVPPSYLFGGSDMPPGYHFQTNHAAPAVPRRRQAAAAQSRRRTARVVPNYQTILRHDADTRGLPGSTMIWTPPIVQRMTEMPTVHQMDNVLEPAQITATPEMMDLEPDPRPAKRRRGRNGNVIVSQHAPPAVKSAVTRKYNRVLTHDAITMGASSDTIVITPPSVARLTTMPARIRTRPVIPPSIVDYSRIRMAEDDINDRPVKRARSKR